MKADMRSAIYSALILDPPPLDPDYFCPVCREPYPYCTCEDIASTGGAEVLEQAGRDDV